MTADDPRIAAVADVIEQAAWQRPSVEHLAAAVVAAVDAGTLNLDRPKRSCKCGHGMVSHEDEDSPAFCYECPCAGFRVAS